MTIRMWADCSNNQGRAADGAALLSMGCTALAAKATEGTDYTDNLFAANYAQAKAAKLDFIAYHFLDVADGPGQAQHFANVVKTTCSTLDIGLMLDWERSGEGIPPRATVEGFLGTLSGMAPKAAISVYTGGWVVAAAGASTVACGYPLVWPSYVNGSGAPDEILKNVTPGFFPPFGGWTEYAARQFTAQAVAGGFPEVDFNVCFNDAAYARLVVRQTAPSGSSTRPADQGATAATSPISSALQVAVHMAQNGLWGAALDASLGMVRLAAHFNQYPSDVTALQRAVGAKQDGSWGPESRADLSATVVAIQKALGGLTPDGEWGPATDSRFAVERAALYKP